MNAHLIFNRALSLALVSLWGGVEMLGAPCFAADSSQIVPTSWSEGNVSFNTNSSLPAGLTLRIQVVEAGWSGRLGVWRVGSSGFSKLWSSQEVKNGAVLDYKLPRKMVVGVPSPLSSNVLGDYAYLGSAKKRSSGAYRLVFTHGDSQRVVDVTVWKHKKEEDAGQ